MQMCNFSWKLKYENNNLKKVLFVENCKCFLDSYWEIQVKVWLVDTNRSSRPDVFCKKGILKNVVKFTEKHLCHSLFFIKVAGPRPVTLLKKRFGTGVFL